MFTAWRCARAERSISLSSGCLLLQRTRTPSSVAPLGASFWADRRATGSRASAPAVGASQYGIPEARSAGVAHGTYSTARAALELERSRSSRRLAQVYWWRPLRFVVGPGDGFSRRGRFLPLVETGCAGGCRSLLFSGDFRIRNFLGPPLRQPLFDRRAPPTLPTFRLNDADSSPISGPVPPVALARAPMIASGCLASRISEFSISAPRCFRENTSLNFAGFDSY